MRNYQRRIFKKIPKNIYLNSHKCGKYSENIAKIIEKSLPVENECGILLNHNRLTLFTISFGQQFENAITGIISYCHIVGFCKFFCNRYWEFTTSIIKGGYLKKYPKTFI
ncbi:hypothetical protein ACFFRR_005497 [Megaselia abdita]